MILHTAAWHKISICICAILIVSRGTAKVKHTIVAFEPQLVAEYCLGNIVASGVERRGRAVMALLT